MSAMIHSYTKVSAMIYWWYMNWYQRRLTHSRQGWPVRTCHYPLWVYFISRKLRRREVNYILKIGESELLQTVFSYTYHFKYRCPSLAMPCLTSVYFCLMCFLFIYLFSFLFTFNLQPCVHLYKLWTLLIFMFLYYSFLLLDIMSTILLVFCFSFYFFCFFYFISFLYLFILYTSHLLPVLLFTHLFVS